MYFGYRSRRHVVGIENRQKVRSSGAVLNLRQEPTVSFSRAFRGKNRFADKMLGAKSIFFPTTGL